MRVKIQICGWDDYCIADEICKRCPLYTEDEQLKMILSKKAKESGKITMNKINHSMQEALISVSSK